MRKLILIISCLFIVIYSKAQEKTYVYGRLTNCDNIQIHIKTIEFDPINLTDLDGASEFGKTLQATVVGDTAFYLETDQIKYPYTRCIFQLGYQAKTILLSPGDSLKMDMDYWEYNSNIGFAGKGAGYNEYWEESERRFGSRRKTLVNEEGFTPKRIDNLVDLRNDRRQILNEYLEAGRIDKEYYSWEIRRNEYSFLAMLLNSSLGNKTADSTSIARIIHYTKDFNCHDTLALFISGNYRSLVEVIPEVLDDSFSKHPIKTLDWKLEFANDSYSGIISSFYQWRIIKQSVDRADTQKQKKMILDYAFTISDDYRIRNLIVQERFAVKDSIDRNNGIWLFGFWGVMLLSFFLIWLSIRSMLRRSKRVNQNHIKVNPILWASVLIAFGFLSPVVDMIFRNPIHMIWPQVSGLMTILYLVLYWRWVSEFFSQKRYVKLIIFTALFAALYITGLYLTFHFYSEWKAEEIHGQIRKWGVIVPVAVAMGSLLNLYLKKMSGQNRPFRHLIAELIKNLETVIHFSLIAALFFYFASQLDDIKGVRNFCYFLVFTLIFYAYETGFSQKKRAYQGFMVALSVMAVILIEAFYNDQILKNSGVNIPFRRFITFPGMVFFLIFIVAGAGGLYRYVRKKYFAKINLNLNLFRKKEAELQQLRSQVNPHFLFNSLNTVYAQALKEKSEQTAESIAKLSNLMRYLIEDMDQETIPVAKEIGYIRDYIRLQKARSSVDPEIRFEVELTEEQEALPIAPMLMIPFVENAFKHGMNPNKKSRLDIRIGMEKGTFIFEIRNPWDPELERFEKEKGFGIGIPNVRKRLEYSYPNKHKLSIEDTETYYQVKLSLNLNA